MSGFDPDEHDNEELEAVRDRIDEPIQQQNAKQGTLGGRK